MNLPPLSRGPRPPLMTEGRDGLAPFVQFAAGMEAAGHKASVGPIPKDTDPNPPAFFTGLDLGQAADWTALVVTERTMRPHPEQPKRTEPHLAVRHLHRFALQTPYPDIVRAVRDLFATPPLAGSVLVVDGTGVGRAVVDMFRQANIRAQLRPMTITGGQPEPGGLTVGKVDLVGCVQALLGTRRLKFAELPLTDVLVKELEQFRVKVNATTRTESFEAWRERDHDDMVLALALACYLACRPQPNVW